MRRDLTRDRILALMREIARSAPPRRDFRVYFVGGNGVINFGCYRKSNDDTPLGCNGTVVRFNP